MSARARLLPLTIRLYRRHFKELLFFSACLASGSAFLFSVENLLAAMHGAVAARARELLAADVELASSRPFDARARTAFEALAARGVRQAGIVSFSSMLKAGSGPPFLVSVKAIEPGYPFYGRLETAPPGAVAAAGTLSCLLDREAALRRGVEIGSSVRLGGADFRVAGLLLREPDRSLFSFNLSPRIMIPASSLERTGLLGFGSRIRHARLLALPPSPDPPTAAQSLKAELESSLADPYLSVTAYGEADPTVRETLRRVSLYFMLVSLVGLTLGCVGMAASVALFLQGQAETAALLRCLGLRSGEILRVYGGLCLAAGVQGGLLGAAGGWALSAWGLSWLGRLIGLDFPVSLAPAPRAVAESLAVACALAVGVNAGKLRAAAHIPPAEALREGGGRLAPSPAATALTLTAGLLALFLYAAAKGESPAAARGFCLALAAASLALAALLLGLLEGLKALLPRLGAPWAFPLRHAVLGLARRRGKTLTVLFTVSMGLSLLGGLKSAHHCLSREILSGRSEGVPDLFLADVQKSQRDAVAAIAGRAAASELEFAPLVRARLTRIGLRPVGRRDLGALTLEERARQRMLTREYNLTYKDRLNSSESVAAGRFWPPGRGAGELSLERSFAERLGVGLGERLVFDVQGRPVEGVVTSLRSISWASMKPNFFVVMPPSALEAAPQTLIASLRVRDAGRAGALQEALAAAAPNVSVIDVGPLLANVSRVLEALLQALAILAWFCVGAGTLVLAGTLAMGRKERLEEAATLRALGLGARTLLATDAWSMAAVALCAFLPSALVSTALGWALARWLDVPFSFDPAALKTTAAAAALPAALGLALHASGYRGSAPAASARAAGRSAGARR